MKFSTVTLSALLVSVGVATPVPGVVYKYVTEFTTVQPGGGPTFQTATPSETQIALLATEAKAAATPETSSIAEAASPAVPTSTASSSAALAQASSSPLSDAGVFSGEATYYDPGLGACGTTHSGSDHVVALSQIVFDKYTPNGNPNRNSLCGKRISVTYKGKSVVATVVDRCVGCKERDVDLSPSAFSAIANKSLGRINVTWKYV